MLSNDGLNEYTSDAHHSRKGEGFEQIMCFLHVCIYIGLLLSFRYYECCTASMLNMPTHVCNGCSDHSKAQLMRSTIQMITLSRTPRITQQNVTSKISCNIAVPLCETTPTQHAIMLYSQYCCTMGPRMYTGVWAHKYGQEHACTALNTTYDRHMGTPST